MKCLFLGYNRKQTRLINFLKRKKIKIINKKSKILIKDVVDKDIIISFGYRYLISKKILNRLKRPIINLHMSYLPYNKGAHPNFWSFIHKTKKGVTIHEVDEDIDTGKIIFQKEIKFNLSKNKKLSFKKTYNILFKELEKLFIKNYKFLIENNYETKKNSKFLGKYNSRSELPADLKNWNINILSYLKNR